MDLHPKHSKEQSPGSNASRAIDATVLLISSGVAIVYSIVETPLWFWIPAWTILGASLAYGFSKKDVSYFTSTVFAVIEVVYICLLLRILHLKIDSSQWAMQIAFGLLFFHGLLYLAVAKPFFIRRGYWKPNVR